MLGLDSPAIERIEIEEREEAVEGFAKFAKTKWPAGKGIPGRPFFCI